MIHLQDIRMLVPPFVWDDVIVVPDGGAYSGISLVDLAFLAGPFGMDEVIAGSGDVVDSEMSFVDFPGASVRAGQRGTSRS